MQAWSFPATLRAMATQTVLALHSLTKTAEMG
jgi:hypothetical protein